MSIEQRLIPVNFSKGRNGYRPTAIVIHLMDGSLKGTDAWFRNPQAQASTHYGVGLNGEVYQWVRDEDTAWGNGRVDRPTWSGIRPGLNPNLYTISIEHEGKSGHVWTDAQYQASADLVKRLADKWGIPLTRDHIIGHSEIYASKPNCPGKGFDFDKFMEMLSNKVDIKDYKFNVIKGDAKPEVYFVDASYALHHVPSWEFFTTYFGGDIASLPQSYVDSLVKGEQF